jgi:hypothetical protein
LHWRTDFPEANVIAGDALAADQAVRGAVAGKSGSMVCEDAVAG